MENLFGENCLRVALIAFNFVFAILSIALIALSIIYTDKLSLVKLYVDGLFINFPILLLVLGVFFVVLICVLALEMTVAVVAFLSVDSEIVETTKLIMIDQVTSPTTTEESFHEIEELFQCCGINNASDYIKHSLEKTVCCGVENCVEELLSNNKSKLWRLPGCAYTVGTDIHQMHVEAALIGTVCSILQVTLPKRSQIELTTCDQDHNCNTTKKNIESTCFEKKMKCIERSRDLDPKAWERAEEFLSDYDENYLVKISMCMKQIVDSTITWKNIFEAEDDIKSRMADSRALYSTPKAQISFDCILFNELHDLFMPMVYKEFEESDEWYFNKVLDLEEVTAEQLGAPSEYTVPLLAAVVELASLDRHKSPLQKMHCLCTTYDFILPRKESEIPVIDNSDVIPILITVIVKSKLIHLYSNFYYINTFFENLKDNQTFRHVLNEFEVAILKMSRLSKNSLKPSSIDLNKNMDLNKFIAVTSDIQSKIRRNRDEMTPLDNHLHNVTELIVTSTNQNQQLPLEKG
ncbi:hypothetical protein FQR65_LT06515 [Abscondita terminalis]|nr:hypothetical protein FQR65_LT06515 [Abscondita terminalis]